MIEWLTAPIDTARAHDVGMHLSWHGRLMVLGWGVLVPGGVLAARYFKVLPGQDWPRDLDNRVWWVLHRGAQYSAGVLMLVSLWLVLTAPAGAVSATPGVWLHHWLGWTVLALAASQYASAWLRGSKGGPTSPAPDGSLRGDHFDMTPRRYAFEYVHKFGGLLAIFLSVAAILTGMWQANAPVWMWVLLLGWWAILLVTARALEQRIGAIDTYQAIWGPDPSLPGNRHRPVGLRILRHGKKRGDV